MGEPKASRPEEREKPAPRHEQRPEREKPRSEDRDKPHKEVQEKRHIPVNPEPSSSHPVERRGLAVGEMPPLKSPKRKEPLGIRRKELPIGASSKSWADRAREVQTQRPPGPLQGSVWADIKPSRRNSSHW